MRDIINGLQSLIGRRMRAVIIVVGVAATLAGCNGLPGGTPPTVDVASGPPLPAATLPTYVVGESYTYDDGVTDTVIGVDGDIVTWQTNTGVVRRRHRDPLLPAVAWQNATRRSKLALSHETPGMWPLKLGNETTFDVHQTVEANDGTSSRAYDQSWQCRAGGTTQAQVPAGTFDAYVVSCYRFVLGTHYWRQTRTFYYAPSLGTYVKREDIYRRGPRRLRNLVAVGFNSGALPRPQQASLMAAFQKAMTSLKDGTARDWHASDRDLTVRLTPTRSFRDTDGAVCRDYTSTYSFAGLTRRNARRACRGADGTWQVRPIPAPTG